MKCEDFLLRKTNVFNAEIPLIVYDIKGREQEVLKKVKDYFGNPRTESGGDYIVVIAKSFMDREVYGFGDLAEIIRRLRDIDGCPWDRKQTNMSIRENAIEEAYELAEAVELNDNAKMLEESGDLLLQGLFNGIIAEEEGRFSLNQVISGICKKLILRHTHIFGNNKASDSQEALKFWEQAKEIEKGQQTIKDKIDAIPKTFGALMRANKAQKIIKKTGFDFPTLEEAEKKLFEEFKELKEADGALEKEKEGGDLLFAAVNILRMLDIDSELALNGAVRRFIKRFEFVEDSACKNGKKVEECTLEEMEGWYQQSKKHE